MLDLTALAILYIYLYVVPTVVVLFVGAVSLALTYFIFNRRS